MNKNLNLWLNISFLSSVLRISGIQYVKILLRTHGITLPEQWGKRGGGVCDETSRIFCGHVNFSEINGEISVYGGTKSDNHKDGG